MTDDAIFHRIEAMSKWNDISDLLRALRQARRESRRLVLDLAGASRVWPNACVPMAAVVQQARSEGCDVRVIQESTQTRNASWRNPIQATPENLTTHRLLSTVWAYFDETEATSLANALIHKLEKTVRFEEGVMEALNFCLYEVLDNVFQHSGAEVGYMMAVLSENDTKLSLAVADVGVGVFNSFKGSKYDPPTHFDALTLAIQAGVTRTGDRRGNGLFALRGTVEENAGTLELRSGPGKLTIRGNSVRGEDFPSTPTLGRANVGLFIDWQLYLTQPVSLSSVLGMPVVNSQLENLENDDGEHVIYIREHDAGTGSRSAAEQLRLYLVNQLSLGAPRLVLDFDGVVVVSASFADEVIGKLAADYGPMRFFSTFILRNMTDTITALLDRAIRLRIGTEPPPAVARR